MLVSVGAMAEVPLSAEAASALEGGFDDDSTAG
jgi:hypothetical protein